MIKGSMRSAQRGMSMWQWLVVLVAAGFFLTLAAKLGPIYITNYSLQSTVKSLQSEPELGSMSNSELRMAVQKKFDVNRIDLINALCQQKESNCLKIERTKTHLKIDANYETRVHIMGNVDAVVVFKNNFVEILIPGGS
jgi:hypothetical protein